MVGKICPTFFFLYMNKLLTQSRLAHNLVREGENHMNCSTYTYLVNKRGKSGSNFNFEDKS